MVVYFYSGQWWIFTPALTPVTWRPLEAENWVVRPPEDYPDAMAHLLARWGMRIGPEPGAENDSFLVINPIGEEFDQFDFLEIEDSVFKAFAHAPRTPEGVVEFANKYGLLHRDVPERVQTWFAHMGRIRSAMSKWEKERDGDMSAFIDAFNQCREISPTMTRLSPQQIPGTPPNIFLEPEDLLSAMWLELAMAVEGNVNFDRCRECPTWFAISPGTNRPDKRYCSDACRMRAYRKRKGI
jgi:hypothetical protein